jgi:hypothetical protein
MRNGGTGTANDILGHEKELLSERHAFGENPETHWARPRFLS